MLFVFVFPFYVLAGILAVAERSPSVPALIGIIALGAVTLAGCLVLALEGRGSAATKTNLLIAGFVLGGLTTYAVSTPPEDWGWMAAITIWIMSVTILTDIALVGGVFVQPFGKAIKNLGGEDEEGRDAKEQAVVERAAIRVLTPLLLIASLVGAILITADTANPPSLVFGNPVIFAGLLVLLLFYGTLLILLPLVRGLVSGEWPVELTTSGLRFNEREKVSEGLAKLGEEMEEAQANIKTGAERSEQAVKTTRRALSLVHAATVRGDGEIAELRARIEALEEQLK